MQGGFIVNELTARAAGDRSALGAAVDPDEPISTIREMCDAFDITPRALRFYESQALISPRRDGQRRLYSSRDRARLKLILRGKRFGFSLAEIRELLDLYDIGDGQVTQLERTLDIAAGKLVQLEERQVEIAEAIGDLRSQMVLVQTMLKAKRDAGET